jgi:hypothetical protein
VLQRKFCREIERMMGVGSESQLQEDVDLRTTASSVVRPVFEMQAGDRPNAEASMANEVIFMTSQRPSFHCI